MEWHCIMPNEFAFDSRRLTEVHRCHNQAAAIPVEFGLGRCKPLDWTGRLVILAGRFAGIVPASL
jgi:hypothetical protein